MGHHADITTGARAIVMGHNGRARSTFMETNNRGPLWTTWSRSMASGPVEGPVGRQFAGPGAGTKPVGHARTAGVPNHLLKRRANDALLQEYV